MQLRQKAEELNELGVKILAIAPDKVELLEPLQKALKLPFPLLSDPQHTVFAHYEMLEGNIPSGGDIVVNKAGVVRYVYHETPNNQIRFADLLSIVKDVVQEGA